MIAGGDCPRHGADVLMQEAHGETVLLHLDSGTNYTVAEVGARVWALCDGARTVDTIVGEFDADPAAARSART